MCTFSRMLFVCAAEAPQQRFCAADTSISMRSTANKLYALQVIEESLAGIQAANGSVLGSSILSSLQLGPDFAARLPSISLHAAHSQHGDVPRSASPSPSGHGGAPTSTDGGGAPRTPGVAENAAVAANGGVAGRRTSDSDRGSDGVGSGGAAGSPLPAATGGTAGGLEWRVNGGSTSGGGRDSKLGVHAKSKSAGVVASGDTPGASEDTITCY
jgi:hypothetical protein